MTVMEMHPYFTEIPLRSFEAMAFEGNLSEVLLALIVDPHEAKDVSLTILDIRPATIELAFGSKTIDAPITLSDFQNLPSKHAFEQLKITLAQWVMTTERAHDALRVLTEWNLRFGVWCACAVAREALRFVPEGELRPLRAIETAEAWVRGTATAAQVSASASAAITAYSSAANANATAVRDATNAAYAVANAATYAAYAADADDASYASVCTRNSAAYTSDAATYAASAAAYARSIDFAGWSIVSEAEITRLRGFAVNACLTFPW
jgi:hypothetical protein